MAQFFSWAVIFSAILDRSLFISASSFSECFCLTLLDFARSAGSVTLVTRGLELPDRGHFSDGFHPRSLVVAEADHAVPRHSHDSTPLWLPADGSKNGTCWP